MTRTHEECLTLLEQIRWNGTPICPYCGSTNSTAYKKERRYHCNSCFTSYSVTVGTLFHKTHVDLQKWFQAISVLMNLRHLNRGISVRKLAQELRVNKNTASLMITRIHKSANTEQELVQSIAKIVAEEILDQK